MSAEDLTKTDHVTVMVALVLLKAFDAINHAILLRYIELTALRLSLKCCIVSYMCGCQSYVKFRSKKSNIRRVKQEVLQGGMISPELYNLYISDIPHPPDGIEIILVASSSEKLKALPLPSIRGSFPVVDHQHGFRVVQARMPAKTIHTGRYHIFRK